MASGFGRQGINTSAMAGLLVARSILWGDERWRLFSPFELVWAGGPTGRLAGHVVGMWARGSSAAAGALARYRERARMQGAPARGAACGSQPPGRRTGRAARRAAVRRRASRARVRRRPRAAGRRRSRPRRRVRGRSRPRRKVRRSAAIPCNFRPCAPYLSANTSRTEKTIMDRRILLASVAGLLGLLSFRWLRAEPAQGRREIRGREDRRRMARATDAAAIRDPAQARHRAAVVEPAAEGAPQGHLRLRRLRPAAVLLRHQVRQRHRLAELLPAARQCDRHAPRTVPSA